MHGAGEWLAAQHAGDERRFLQLLGGSFAAHVALVLLLGFAPQGGAPPMPQVLRVNLVAAVEPGPAAARNVPAPAPAPPKPVAKPVVKPVVKPKQIVLPKEAPKAVPQKRVAPPVSKPARPEPLEYQDALSSLRDELGEAPPSPLEAETAPPAEAATSGSPATSGPVADARGAAVSPELAAWYGALKSHFDRCWINPPEFLNRGLVTGVRVDLTSTGVLIGPPVVTRPSGDPFFDDNTLRAVTTCEPLPAPPQPGEWAFSFNSEGG